MGMHIPHILASCMGGIRTAGDLVAWMQLAGKLKIDEAKTYVAEKLGVGLLDLADEDIMRHIRVDLEPGTVTSIAGSPKGIRAKRNAARLLDIDIRSVNLFKSHWHG